MKWIKVSERLPEDDLKIILALTDCCSLPHLLAKNHSYKCYCNDPLICPNVSTEWVFLRDDSGYHYKDGNEAKFSHWVEIEPPED